MSKNNLTFEQKLNSKIRDLAKHKDSDGYFGYLSCGEVLAPLLVEAYESVKGVRRNYVGPNQREDSQAAVKRLDDLLNRLERFTEE